MWVVIWAFILSIVPPLLVRIVVMLGLSIVTYTGISLVLDDLRDSLFGLYDNIGTDAIQIMDLAGIFDGISIFFTIAATALGYKLLLAGVSGSISRYSVRT